MTKPKSEHVCECGSDQGVTQTFMGMPLMSWCRKCGKAYDPLNDFVRVPEEDKTPEQVNEIYIAGRRGGRAS